MALGIPLVVLTTLVGTSVFATLQETLNTRMRIFAGLAIVLAAVLASLQSFLSSAERAEKNWAAGEMWAAIRREITEVLALHPANLATRDDPRQYLDELRARMDEVAKESPVMSSHLFCTHLQARWASINLWTAHGPPNSNFAASFSHTRRNWKEITDGHR
jgi:hypothetical protein